MPKAGSKRIASKNEVTRRLSKGNGNIKGLKMCAAVDDRALIPVEVVGVTFLETNNYQCGVNVAVKPIGGYGELVVSPTSLIDDTPESHDLFRRKCQAQQRHSELKEAKSDRERRSLVLAMRANMTTEQKVKFDALAEDFFGKDADMVKSIAKASGDWSLSNVGQRAAKILFDVDDVEVYDD